MNIKKFIPKRIKLSLRRLSRYINDWRSGHHSLFAGSIKGEYSFNYFIVLSQPIKNSYLYENKMENIKLAGRKINTVIIQPGEIFSFWKIVGEPNQKNGFKKGRNVISGTMAEDYGGGLCQLSGIIYHLSLRSGLEILERYNHSVDFYTEENRYTPIGSDATIVYGYKDLRMKNNFDFPIRFSVGVAEERLILNLWSTSKIDETTIVFEREEKDTTIEVVGLTGRGDIVNKSSYVKQKV